MGKDRPVIWIQTKPSFRTIEIWVTAIWLLKLLVIDWMHLMIVVAHLHRLHHRGPFRHLLLTKLLIRMACIDVLFHPIAIILVHGHWNWLNLHYWWSTFFAVRYANWLLSISFDTVGHLIVVYVTELVLLRRNISFNTCSISTI